MNHALLQMSRWGQTPFGTFGTLRFGHHTWYTVEDRWADNVRFLSCIPIGTYVCRVAEHQRLGDCIAVEGVTDRDAIFVHIANDFTDVEGCIGIGTALGMLNGRWAVLNSRIAMSQLLRHLDAFSSLRLRITVDVPTMFYKRKEGKPNGKT